MQLVAGDQFSLGAGIYINVGGGGGAPTVSSNFGDNSSGGSILLEAKGVQIAGVLAANGGGGGGVSAVGINGTPDAKPAPGGAKTGEGAGGAGGAAMSIDGATPASVDRGRRRRRRSHPDQLGSSSTTRTSSFAGVGRLGALEPRKTRSGSLADTVGSNGCALMAGRRGRQHAARRPSGPGDDRRAHTDVVDDRVYTVGPSYRLLRGEPYALRRD